MSINEAKKHLDLAGQALNSRYSDEGDIRKAMKHQQRALRLIVQHLTNLTALSSPDLETGVDNG